MTISILIRTEGQKIARPFNRACSLEELDEIITHWVKFNRFVVLSCKIRDNFGSDEPIVTVAGSTGRVEFYAFMEH